MASPNYYKSGVGQMWKFSDHLAQYGVELKGTYLLLILIIYQSGLLGDR